MSQDNGLIKVERNQRQAAREQLITTMLQGRTYVTPEDVKSIGPDVLRHRLILTYEAEAQAVTTDAIIKKLFNAVPVP